MPLVYTFLWCRMSSCANSQLLINGYLFAYGERSLYNTYITLGSTYTNYIYLYGFNIVQNTTISALCNIYIVIY